MPSGKNWVDFLYINIAFAIYIVAVFYFNQIAQIKAKWPLYRCNPMYMFLADNVEENFVYCVQSMQTNFMGYLLQPITFIIGSMSTMLGGFMRDIQYIRAMFYKIRTLFSSIFESIFGVFLNLMIEFIRITISIKDTVSKNIGIMISMMYMMDGSMKTMKSTWNGPPGQMVRALGKCFDTSTRIKLKNGKIKKICDIILGDVLEDSSVVEATMRIDNKNHPVPMYVIKEAGVEGDDIYVTGSHLVYDNSFNKFIKVENYLKAEHTDYKPDVFSCLITSYNRITIGSEIFWDWEDHFIKARLSTMDKMIYKPISKFL
jgi:hypothetical protein